MLDRRFRAGTLGRQIARHGGAQIILKQRREGGPCRWQQNESEASVIESEVRPVSSWSSLQVFLPTTNVEGGEDEETITKRGKRVKVSKKKGQILQKNADYGFLLLMPLCTREKKENRSKGKRHEFRLDCWLRRVDRVCGEREMNRRAGQARGRGKDQGRRTRTSCLCYLMLHIPRNRLARMPATFWLLVRILWHSPPVQLQGRVLEADAMGSEHLTCLPVEGKSTERLCAASFILDEPAQWQRFASSSRSATRKKCTAAP